MFSAFSPRSLLAVLGLTALLGATACHTPPPPPTVTDPLAALTYDGDQQALVSLDRDIAAAGQDPVKLAAISTRLVAVLQTPAATGAARQTAAEHLGLFPATTLTAGDLPALWTAMLADERRVNDARLALDRVPGAAIDRLYLAALVGSAPAPRLALVQSLGNRRAAAAVPALSPFLAEADATVAAAAAKALGQIGTPAALVALRSAPHTATAAIVEARLTAAHQIGGASALAEFTQILATPAAPAHLRAAALHGLLFAEPAAASSRLLAALTGNDPALKPVALETIATLPAPDLVPALSARLDRFDVPTQVAVLAAFGRRHDAAAVPAVLAATRHADATVRSAALAALGQLPGNPAVVDALVALIAGPNLEETKIARLALARLDGPGVSEAVLAGAKSAAPELRVACLDALAARNQASALPVLLKLRSDRDAAVRTAALGALADLAPFAEQPAILAWAVAATDAAEQARALRTLASVSARGPDASTQAQLITQTIDASTPTVQLRLLPVLPRIGGTATAECTARLALSPDPDVATAATATLARWTDPAGLAPLVHVAELAKLPAARTAAVTGALRYLERSRELAAGDLEKLLARLLLVATDEDSRRQLIYLYSRSSEPSALAALDKFKADSALTATAADAALVIQARQAGPTIVLTSANAGHSANLIDNNPKSNWGVPALATQWIQLDFNLVRPFRQIVVDGGTNQNNYPEHLELCVTDDPQNPGAPLVSVEGHVGKNILDLPAGTRGRYVIIRHSKERQDAWWTVAEITVD